MYIGSIGRVGSWDAQHGHARHARRRTRVIASGRTQERNSRRVSVSVHFNNSMRPLFRYLVHVMTGSSSRARCAPYNDLIPNQPEWACCPACNSDLISSVYASLNDDAEQDDSARALVCESCRRQSRLNEVRFSPEATFAQFYFCVSECELDTWPKGFLGLVENALGRCVAHEESTT